MIKEVYTTENTNAKGTSYIVRPKKRGINKELAQRNDNFVAVMMNGNEYVVVDNKRYYLNWKNSISTVNAAIIDIDELANSKAYNFDEKYLSNGMPVYDDFDDMRENAKEQYAFRDNELPQVFQKRVWNPEEGLDGFESDIVVTDAMIANEEKIAEEAETEVEELAEEVEEDTIDFDEEEDDDDEFDFDQPLTVERVEDYLRNYKGIWGNNLIDKIFNTSGSDVYRISKDFKNGEVHIRTIQDELDNLKFELEIGEIEQEDYDEWVAEVKAVDDDPNTIIYSTTGTEGIFKVGK